MVASFLGSSAAWARKDRPLWSRASSASITQSPTRSPIILIRIGTPAPRANDDSDRPVTDRPRQPPPGSERGPGASGRGAAVARRIRPRPGVLPGAMRAVCRGGWRLVLRLGGRSRMALAVLADGGEAAGGGPDRSARRAGEAASSGDVRARGAAGAAAAYGGGVVSEGAGGFAIESRPASA